MKYICEVIINASLDKVIAEFKDKMVMNKEIAVGNKHTSTYDIDENNKLIMTETIESINLPEEIITIYEVDKVWNRCVNKFKVVDDKVVYTMLVEFIFDDESKVSKVAFQNKTQSQMDDFKKIVEEA